MRMGIDIGGVIVQRAGLGDTSFEQEHLKTPPMPDAFETIARLASEHDVWIISKCYPRMQRLSRQWLEHGRFFEITGVRRDRLLFCLKRPEKALIARELGLDAFIDDREDVLEAMVGVVPRRILFRSWREVLAQLT